MLSDPLGDLFSRIRNGFRAGKTEVRAPASRLQAGVLDVLRREGYIEGWKPIRIREGIDQFVITLRYHEGQPAIRQIERVSRPGRRVYRGVREIGWVYNGLGTYILSTSQGIMSDYQSRKRRLGGEILCRVF